MLVWFCLLVRSASHLGVILPTQLWQLLGTTLEAKQLPLLIVLLFDDD